MYWKAQRASCCLARIRTCCDRPSALRFHRRASTARFHRRASTARDPPPAADSSWPCPIASSSILVRSKSTFEAFASGLPRRGTLGAAQDDAAQFITHLKATISRTRRATHAMWAWCSEGASRADDGGEAGAGERLERLVEGDVVLVVFRWYGGVPLGSQRWKCISQVAKEALEAGQFRGKGSGGFEEKKVGGRRKR
ncbi:hypothetical protein C8Q72DRAFT_235178 [Fomitopsis betulina]|nr:hypothetical protein C8Q72DRAFT_235178 [Fomitopsis betulina]